jgi:hypothetical protein
MLSVVEIGDGVKIAVVRVGRRKANEAVISLGLSREEAPHRKARGTGGNRFFSPSLWVKIDNSGLLFIKYHQSENMTN